MEALAIALSILAFCAFIWVAFQRAARNQRAVLLDKPTIRRFSYQPLPTTVV